MNQHYIPSKIASFISNSISNQNDKDICLNIESEEIPLTFKDFTNSYKWPNMGSLRKMAYESETNGLKTAFLKIGRRRLVLPKTLFKLLKDKGCK